MATTDSKYLNGSGLSTLWSRIKSYFVKKNWAPSSGTNEGKLLQINHGEDVDLSSYTTDDLAHTAAATSSVRGTVFSNGTISSTTGYSPNVYTLSTTGQAAQANGKLYIPIATSSTHGVVKLGTDTEVSSNIKLVGVNSSGQLAVSVADTGTATATSEGTGRVASVVDWNASNTPTYKKVVYISKSTNTANGANTFIISAATTSQFGVVKVGSNIDVNTSTGSDDYGTISVTKPTSSKLGVVGISYSASGTNYALKVDSSGNGYVTVPNTDISSKQDKIKVGTATSGAVTTISAGSNISITISGSTATVASTYSYTLPTMAANVKGGAFLGSGLYIDEDHLNLEQASSSQLGGVLLVQQASGSTDADKKACSYAWIDENILTPLIAKAPLASPTFTGTPLITTTPTANDNSHKIADTAYVDNAVSSAVAGATQFQGSISNETGLKTHGDYKKGEYWLVNFTPTSASPTVSIAGVDCEPGDMIYCINNRTHTSGGAITNSDFTVIQGNIDPDVYVRDDDYLTDTEIDAIIASAS